MFRRRARAVVVGCVVALAASCATPAPRAVIAAHERFTDVVALPAADNRGTVSLDDAIARRRSTRTFAPTPLPLSLVGQLLWAAQGITGSDGKRAAPSAGALYPLELYVVTADEVMHYLPAGHRVEVRAERDLRPDLQRAALRQSSVGSAPAVVVVAAVMARTRAKYGAQAGDFVNREVGHATENLLLEATSRGLAAVPIGAFDPATVAAVIGLPPGETVLGLVPVGFPPAR